MNVSLRVALTSLLLAGLTIGTVAAAADAKLAQVAGNWLTEPHDGIIQVTVGADGRMEGRIVGGNHPGLTDENNSDPTRRKLALRGQVILRNMKYDGDGHWSGGTIYDPKKGREFKCQVELLDSGALKVRGYMGISLFGISQTWTRYAGTSMDLPPAH
jgi:uncharacterized protein (DUF2147 family)